MAIESSLDLILALLYAPGKTGKICEEIKDITRLVKLLFLLIKEGNFKRLEKELSFEAYDYGPWSGEIFDNLETLKGLELLQTREISRESYEEVADEIEWIHQTAEAYVPERKVSIFVLTERGKIVGKNIFESLNPDEKEIIERIKREYNRIPLQKLLEYVYKRYPEVTIKSKIREKVVPSSMFGISPDLPKFKREEEDFRR